MRTSLSNLRSMHNTRNLLIFGIWNMLFNIDVALMIILFVDGIYQATSDVVKPRVFSNYKLPFSMKVYPYLILIKF